MSYWGEILQARQEAFRFLLKISYKNLWNYPWFYSAILTDWNLGKGRAKKQISWSKPTSSTCTMLILEAMKKFPLVMQLLGWGVQEGRSVKSCKVLEDNVRKNACIWQKVNFRPSLLWGWSRKGLRFLHGKGHSFPSHLSLESCLPLQSEYRTAQIRTWTMKALAKDHKDFTYLQKCGESWGGLQGCVTV